MDKKLLAEKVIQLLQIEFPDVSTPLIHSSAFELLVATILSAQSLDSTTNKVTPAIFEQYPDPLSLSKAAPESLMELIRSVNYYKTKSAHLIKMSRMLVEQYNSMVPNSIEQLIQLPGVGRKTANVVINEWFRKKEGIVPEGFVVDTHVKRVSKRLGFTQSEEPEKVEIDLMAIFPKEDWPEASLRMIFHGRKTCTSRNPNCVGCPLNKICPSAYKVST